MLRKILFYYCCFLALFIFISGLLTSRTPAQFFYQLLFFPVAAYFGYHFLLHVRGKHVAMPFSKGNNRQVITVIGCIFFMLFTYSIFDVMNSSPDQTETPKIMFSEAGSDTAGDTPSYTPAVSPSATPKGVPTTTPTSLPTASPVPKGTSSVVIQEKYQKNNISIRAKPSPDAEIIEKMLYGKPYEIIFKQDDWYQIKLDNDRTGYVNASFVQKQ